VNLSPNVGLQYISYANRCLLYVDYVPGRGENKGHAHLLTTYCRSGQARAAGGQDLETNGRHDGDRRRQTEKTETNIDIGPTYQVQSTGMVQYVVSRYGYRTGYVHLDRDVQHT
jgi:hypothetical protein